MEYRTREIQFRAAQDDSGTMTAAGRAILYGVEVVLWSDGEYEEREIIMPGAATESISNDDIRALWNHKRDIVLGRKSRDTLRLTETEDGVEVEIDFPDSEEGRSKFASIERGDVDQMSFGFDILDAADSRETVDGKHIFRREIRKFKLWEVSPVTFPAYEDTAIQARREHVREAFREASGERHDTAVSERETILREQEIKLLEGKINA